MRVTLLTKELAIGYKKSSGTIQVTGNINLACHAGEFICLIGPNGVGKSTLIRTLAGLQSPIAGEVHLNQRNISKLHPLELATLVSIVLTEPIPVNDMYVADLIALGRSPYLGWLGQLSAYDNNLVLQAAHATNITTLLDKKVFELSDGEKQKVMVTRALVQDTPLIVLDEPTAHLDLPNRFELMQLLKQLSRDGNKTIILSTHDLELALQLADTLWLMNSDTGITTGAPEDLVLKGILSKTFSRGNIFFENGSATFQLHNFLNSHFVCLEGSGFTYEWTKKALARHGYGQATGMATRITIQDSPSPVWQIEAGGIVTIVTSVKDLLLNLDAHFHPYL